MGRTRRTRSQAKRTPARHVYQADDATDHNGQSRCARPGCGLPRTRTDIHDPPQPDNSLDQRRLGERSD